MSTATANLMQSTSNPTVVRALFHFIVDQLLAWGWTQTSDTGQTATDSLPAEANTNTVAGYQIWGMGDALQATAPVYVKIEIASSSTTSAPAIWITVGTGTNGAGTLTGQTSGRIGLLTTTAPVSTLYASYASGDLNRCAFALFVGAQVATTEIFFSIERSKDASGNDTGDGIIVFGVGGAALYSQYVPASGSVRTAQTAPTLPVCQGVTTLADGSDVGLIPLLPMSSGGTVNPGNCVWFYYRSDLTTMNPMVATLKGSSHTVLPLGVAYTNYSNWANHSYAMLYE